MKKEYCVISHTHWDREWYFTFEQFRYRLVKLIDNLLEIMEKEKEYIFHLDAQTIVLEDYLQIKPQNREKLEKYIKEGRIIVGPWYVQNDFFLTDGESTIRNLMIGTKIANSFGGCGDTGYIPDQFGNISQLPQIFNSFGVETCLLGRGYTFYERDEEGKLKVKDNPAEFYWDGKDGSRVFSVRFTHWYNNAQRFSEDADKNVLLINHIESVYNGTDRVPVYLLMNGVDHLEAQENLFDVLPPLNEKLADGVVKQCTMKEYTDKAQKYIEENNVPMNVHVGELRMGGDYNMLKGTLSSRVYLKIANSKAQDKIENRVEPLCTMAKALGFDGLYPVDYLEYLWKLLIQNHPHDSICGCSVDAVHRNMMDRTARFNETADEVINDALSVMTSHISRDGMNENDYMISVFNTSENVVSGVCETECNFPMSEEVASFEILDENGNKVPLEVVRKDDLTLRTTSPINLPGEIDCDSYLVKIFAENVPAMGYKSYVVRKSENAIETVQEDVADKNGAYIENERFAVVVNDMGEISVTDKNSGKTYENCIRLSDTGDKGDLYVYYCMKENGAIETDEIKPESVRLLKDTELEKSCLVRYNLMLPECADFNKWRRSEKLVENVVEIKLTLSKGNDWIDIECNVDNKSSDHRLRILFDTYMNTDYTTSLVPFDTVQRDRRDDLLNICTNGTQPDSGLVYIGENGNGIGIMNEGLYEYEHINDEKGTVAVTLLRSVGIITQRPNRYRRMLTRTYESQCIGKYTMHLGLAFESGEKGEAVSRLVRKTKNFRNSLVSHFQPYSVKKFTGGRPQVQDTDIAELFFRPDVFENNILGRSGKIFDVIGENMAVSAVKMSDDEKMLVVRAYNTSDNETNFGVQFTTGNVLKAYKLNMNEVVTDNLEIKNGKTTVNVKPREIVTLGFCIEK